MDFWKRGEIISFAALNYIDPASPAVTYWLIFSQGKWRLTWDHVFFLVMFLNQFFIANFWIYVTHTGLFFFIGILRESIPRKNLLRVGHCPKYLGDFKKKRTFYVEVPHRCRKKQEGGQGNFDNVQIEADFFSQDGFPNRSGFLNFIFINYVIWFLINLLYHIVAYQHLVWGHCSLQWPFHKMETCLKKQEQEIGGEGSILVTVTYHIPLRMIYYFSEE